MPKPIINLHDLEFHPRPEAMRATGSAADVFDAKSAPVGVRIGAQKLGFNLTAVPPGTPGVSSAGE